MAGINSALGSTVETQGQPVTETPPDSTNLLNAAPFAITDIPGGHPGRPRTAGVSGVVIHHTGGSSLAGAYGASKDNGTGANYYVDRDGSVVRRVPEDQYTAHIREPHSRYRNGSHPDLGNANTVGIEVVAKDDKDVTPEQRKAVSQLTDDIVQRNGVDPKNVVGHGELQGGPHGNREPDEGAASAKEYRDGSAPQTAVANTAPTADVTNKLQADAAAEVKRAGELEKQTTEQLALDRSQATNPETNKATTTPVEHDPFADTVKAAMNTLTKPAAQPEVNTGEALTNQQSATPIAQTQPLPLSGSPIFGQLAANAGLTSQFLPVEKA